MIQIPGLPADSRRKGKAVLSFFLLIFLMRVPRGAADTGEDINYISRGTSRILTAAFELPRYLFDKTMNEPILIGTVDGVLTGAYYTVAEFSGGAFDILRGVAPYAKYLLFFV